MNENYRSLIIQILNESIRDELSSGVSYIRLTNHVSGLESAGLVGELKEHATDEFNHFSSIVEFAGKLGLHEELVYEIDATFINTIPSSNLDIATFNQRKEKEAYLRYKRGVDLATREGDVETMQFFTELMSAEMHHYDDFAMMTGVSRKLNEGTTVGRVMEKQVARQLAASKEEVYDLLKNILKSMFKEYPQTGAMTVKIMKVLGVGSFMAMKEIDFEKYLKDLFIFLGLLIKKMATDNSSETDPTRLLKFRDALLIKLKNDTVIQKMPYVSFLDFNKVLTGEAVSRMLSDSKILKEAVKKSKNGDKDVTDFIDREIHDIFGSEYKKLMKKGI